MRRLRKLTGERGMALVMAIGIMAVLGIVGTTLVYYSVSNVHSTAHSAGGQRAFALAEAGLNDAVGILSTIGNDPASANLLPSSASPAAVTVDDGTISYWGSYNSGAAIWTVTGKGTVRNPSQASAITRKITQQYSVSSSPSWKYIYMDNPSGCLNLSSSVQITQPLFLRGSLCLDNSAVVTSTASPVTVAGGITVSSGASGSVGRSTAHIAALHVGTGCRYGSGSYVFPCTSTEHVYADSQDNYIDPTIRKAPIDTATWYDNAKPGPKQNCTSGSFPGGFDTDATKNRSLPTVDLMPASAYDCTVTLNGATVGRIAWTPGNPGTMTVLGTIFFDGNISMSGSAKGVYSGRAAIYSSGTVNISGSTEICGAFVSGHCDWTNWNPDVNMLVLVAGSTTDTPDFTTGQSAQIQGGIYAATDYTQGSSVKQQGPIQAQNITLGSSGQTGYPGQASVPYGAPGGSVIAPVTGTWNG
jgi:hypothetical protein